METHAHESQEEPGASQGRLDMEDAPGTAGPRLRRGVIR